jgi:hypothetical protein
MSASATTAATAADQSNLSAEEKLAQLKSQLSQLYAGGDKDAQPAADQTTSAPQAPGSLPFDDFVLGRVREKDDSKSKEESSKGDLPILDFGGETA